MTPLTPGWWIAVATLTAGYLSGCYVLYRALKGRR